MVNSDGLRAPLEVRTDRLLLRQWKESDRTPLAEMNGDAEVMAGYPRTLTREESDAWFDKVSKYFADRGFGLYAVEVPGEFMFIGFSGLSILTSDDQSQQFEIAFRFSRQSWGKGYAREAGRAVLRVAFEKLQFPEIMTYTSEGNAAGRRGLEGLGLAADEPDAAHPGRVVYRITSHAWDRLEIK